MTKPNRAPVFKSKGKKCEHMDDSLDLELADKHHKGMYYYHHYTHLTLCIVSSPINISDSDVSHNGNHSLLGSLSNNSDNQYKPDPPLPALPPSSPPHHSTSGSLGNSSDIQYYEPDLPLPALPPSSPPHYGTILPGIPLGNSNKENVPVILKNPLVNIFGGPSGIPKFIPTPAIPLSTDSSKGGPVKMLEDVARFYEEWKMNKNGTMDKFKLYWNTLAMAQQDEYQAEAKHLDSAGAWKKASDSAVVNGALH
ncbi:uncharacterized protein BJ212DRAFT_1485211 [Suillus subaureus]|uniref:Uncharacterized protein n=1 Tax=Suillus subaureus TaxID=48587 RepID=A0A9P7J897_9AGAM|nr:uncharacterized protein BJ212DRAFT_1485211 [Suillus subaureus]KAG1808275.1 hypothetical protein BJ212DRAFT_1485211 [Suillus subaureus]